MDVEGLTGFESLSVDLNSIQRSIKDSKYSYIYNALFPYKPLFFEILILLFIGLTYTTSFVFSKYFATREIAVRNSYGLVNTEIRLGVFVEPNVQSFILSNSSEYFILFMNNFYLFAHLPCSISFLLWVFFARKKDYYVFRNSFLLSQVICITLSILFPCAPPRMLGELGFVDTMMVYSKADLMILEENAGVNPYAAMPSMHFAYAFIVGIWGVYLTESWTIKSLFVSYTLFVCFGILVTGNHFIMDCFASLIIILFSHMLVVNRKEIQNFCNVMYLAIIRKPNYWWMFILVIFGTIVIILHMFLRIIKLMI